MKVMLTRSKPHNCTLKSPYLVIHENNVQHEGNHTNLNITQATHNKFAPAQPTMHIHIAHGLAPQFKNKNRHTFLVFFSPSKMQKAPMYTHACSGSRTLHTPLPKTNKSLRGRRRPTFYAFNTHTRISSPMMRPIPPCLDDPMVWKQALGMFQFAWVRSAKRR